MTSLTIELTEQQRRSLEARAARQGKTLSEYAVDLLSTSGPDDDAWAELKAVIERRVTEGLAGPVSEKRVLDILDEEFRGEARA